MNVCCLIIVVYSYFVAVSKRPRLRLVKMVLHVLLRFISSIKYNKRNY